VCAAGCANLVPRPTPPEARPGEPWRTARAALVARINAVRAEAGVPRLAYDRLLERVGDAHCAELLADGVQGHFALSGVPPYLRYLLAGGDGYHRENAAAFSSTAAIAPDQLTTILLTSLGRMLAERPPHDGHRRTILNPTITEIGIGLAWSGGELRMTQEFATRVATEWTPLPVKTTPHATVTLAGRLPRLWKPVMVEVCWEELPHPLTVGEVEARHSYAYPPPRFTFSVVDHGANFGTGMPAAWVALDRHGNFTFRWQVSPRPGVEIAVVWARRGGGRTLFPVGASATVVTAAPTLPAALERWRNLRLGAAG
jgi:uncharacterized protein YkwD